MSDGDGMKKLLLAMSVLISGYLSAAQPLTRSVLGSLTASALAAVGYVIAERVVEDATKVVVPATLEQIQEVTTCGMLKSSCASLGDRLITGITAGVSLYAVYFLWRLKCVKIPRSTHLAFSLGDTLGSYLGVNTVIYLEKNDQAMRALAKALDEKNFLSDTKGSHAGLRALFPNEKMITIRYSLPVGFIMSVKVNLEDDFTGLQELAYQVCTLLLKHTKQEVAARRALNRVQAGVTALGYPDYLK